jgi:glycosyltransferase involved in cell wall biosynthesis
MKIAVFHNFMDNLGGAEVVTLSLARGLDADIYTTNIDIEQIKKMGFEDVVPRIRSLGKIPKMAPFRHQLAFWKFRRLNLGRTYDFYIISGDWAMSGAVNNHPNLWYVHSPLNELWAFKDYVRNNLLTWWKKPIFDIWVSLNRKLTLKYSKYVDVWVCNSVNTQNRIKKYYGKDATVVHPPVDISKHAEKKSEGFWLSVNRLTINKRIELQMKAFSKLPDEKLIIVGSYEKGAKQFEDYKRRIELIKPANVEIMSWVDYATLVSLYDTSKGFITTAKDEDFGMTPIEAMASGKPVIAPNEGGYKETVIDGKTGILIDDINEDKIIKAIETISSELRNNPQKYKDLCLDQSKKFDVKVFLNMIVNSISGPYNISL